MRTSRKKERKKVRKKITRAGLHKCFASQRIHKFKRTSSFYDVKEFFLLISVVTQFTGEYSFLQWQVRRNTIAKRSISLVKKILQKEKKRKKNNSTTLKGMMKIFSNRTNFFHE